MTRREYLHEDLRLIQRYFPGAKTVDLTTPFDLNTDLPKNPWELLADDSAEPYLGGVLQWNR